MMELLFDTSEQEAECDKLLEEAQVVSDAVQQNIYENAHVALDQKAYQKKYDDLTARYETLKTRIEDLNEQISQTQSQKGSVEDFLAAFEKLPETLTAFSLDNFNALTDYLTVNSEGDISVTFRNGQTIKA
jgi:site-specific DNA recombinase